MSHRRVNKHVAASAGTAAVALVAAAILLPGANASPDDSPAVKALSQPEAAQMGTGLASTLGDDAAGWYYDADQSRLVMNVLNEDAADDAEAEGAVARIVKNSMADLKASSKVLSDGGSVAGTAWSIDPKSNKVMVLADSTVTGEKWNSLVETTSAMGDTVAVKQTAGEFKPLAEGGDAIFGGNSRCSLGFNVEVNGAPGFLTAGHCGEAGQAWTGDQTGNEPLGTTAESEFPVSDFSLVTYDDPNTDAPSEVNLQDGTAQEITRAAEASVGMPVQRSGSTTGLSDGVVTGLDTTVDYGNGDIVNGLIQTDVCAEPGDSGGAMFSGDAAVGLTSGGSGNCTQGGVTFFQPVTAALAAVGAEIPGAGGEDGGADGGADAGAAAAGGTDAGAAAAGGTDAGAAAAGGTDAGAAAAGGTDAGAAAGGTDAGAAAAGGTDAGAAAAGGTDAGAAAAAGTVQGAGHE